MHYLWVINASVECLDLSLSVGLVFGGLSCRNSFGLDYCSGKNWTSRASFDNETFDYKVDIFLFQSPGKLFLALAGFLLKLRRKC